MRTGRYSLSELFDNDFVDCIIIPEMQRDYVWTPENVDGLMNSIETNYRCKEVLNLSITNGGVSVEDVALSYLTKEYERLRFNTRIGFIYAYYDASDSRILYLIDGQQRITTLFLLLLAAYVKGGDEYCREFRKRYFPNNMPRLDYRVRENAHNFLVDFIEYTLSLPKGDFDTESGRVYADYFNDPTIRSIRNNYKRISERLASIDNDLSGFIDYLENYIEFNYFDTGLSSQGEHLYLYMNSRGEGLSLQEDIRPVIISRSKNKDKIEAGRLWEKWQNYFWRYRGDSENADNGFWGFLKLAVIIHQAKNDFPKWNDFTNDSGITLSSLREVKEAFINKKYLDKQHSWVRKYIHESSTFDIHWLQRSFNAYRRLSVLFDESGSTNEFPFRILRIDNWRSVEAFDTIHYIPICGLLALLVWQPKITDENLYRYGMYLLNRCDDSNNSKVPASSTIRAIELSLSMSESGIQDIRQLRKYPKLTYENHNMKYKGDLIWQHIESSDWERLFWELTANPTLDSFFDGNHDVLVKLSDEDGNYTVDGIRKSNELFIEKFFKHRDDKQLRKDLLSYGDLSLEGGNNTCNFGEEMERYKFPETEEWPAFFKDDNSIDIVRRYINEAAMFCEGWRTAIAKALDYTDKYRYLWKFEEGDVMPNIILLKSTQAKENLARCLAAHLLAKKIGGWNWEGNHRYADLDFIIRDSQFIKVERGAGMFAFDFTFYWDSQRPRWSVALKKRGENGFTQNEMNVLDKVWITSQDPTKLILVQEFFETEGYRRDGTLKSIDDIVEWLEDYKPKIAACLQSLVS